MELPLPTLPRELRFSYLTTCEFRKLDLKISDVCCNQSFRISPYAKFRKFDKKSQVYLGQSFHILLHMKFENFDRSPRFFAIKVFVFGYMQNSKSWMLTKLEKKSQRSPRYPTYQSFRPGRFLYLSVCDVCSLFNLVMCI